MKADKFKRDPDKALRLSKLEPDADKDFEGVGFTNVMGIDTTMAVGDVVFKGPSVLRPLPPGMVGYVLVSAGPGHSPYWAPVSSSSEKWISAPIRLNLDGTSVFGRFDATEALELDSVIEAANYILTTDDIVLTMDGTVVSAIVADEAIAGEISCIVASVVA